MGRVECDKGRVECDKERVECDKERVECDKEIVECDKTDRSQQNLQRLYRIFVDGRRQLSLIFL